MQDDAPKPRRPRFSLLNLVLLMTIAAMAVALWRLTGELAPLRAEVAKHRRELGYLFIPESEAGKTHAIAIEAEEEHEWRYRIYLPEGRKYRLRFAHGVLPGRTADNWAIEDYLADVARATSGGSTSWSPGESVLSFRVRREEAPNDPRENWVFETRRVGASKGSTTLTAPWMADERSWSSSSSMVGSEQKSFDPAKPLPLLTVRRSVITENSVGGYSVTSPKLSKESDGFMLWIESL